jgi:hypothetical protein
LVASCAGLVDAFVAVDGAYGLYPNGQPASDPGQREAIERTATAHGVACKVHVPSHRWAGNEVEKRAFMFRYALESATPGRDWLLIIDGDQVVERMDASAVRSALATTTLDVAVASSRMQKDPDEFQPNRSLFRALPGLTVEKAHYNYTTVRDGRRVYLWHPEPVAERSGAQAEPTLDLTRHLLIRHRSEPRPAERMAARARYYVHRSIRELSRFT